MIESDEWMTYTFEEFVEFGRNQPGANIVAGVPWSFNFYDHVVTHETDDLYLVGMVRFYRGEVIRIHKTTLQAEIRD